MRIQFLLYLSLAALLMASCVGNRKQVYLQDKSKSGEERFFPETQAEVALDTYRLRSGDILFINIEKFRVGQELFTISSFQQLAGNQRVNHPYMAGYKIDPMGNITLPLLGSVKAADRTAEQLQLELRVLAAKEYPDAVVEVFQLDGTVSIIGEVSRPGRYPLYKGRNSILDAVAMAGDLTPFADRAQVKVIRILENGQELTIVDLNDISLLGTSDYYVQNDDIIIISPLRRKKFVTTNIQWAISSITALVAVTSLIVNISR